MTATYEDLPDLMTRMTGDEKHGASATSTLDVIWVLYHHVLRIDMNDPDRDRFLVSKGHGPMAYYAVLAAHGFIPFDLLDTFGEFDSPLGYHPDRTLVPGVEISSGSLGHGLPIATGTATALRLRSSEARVVVLLGDAELDEGSNIEAIQYAGRSGLGNLTAVVIDNESAGLGWPGGISARFTVEGWTSTDVDGRDHAALRRAFAAGTPNTPHVVVAHVERKDS
ncbi:thiamine pyrophosphate-dependent enzyme [Rhodococcus sp. G-MC3]|uniref:thiamine pyrophosphate-dependent enzyme n=1 Tax=Rhodococcus sp. G-MC3 TaxID=3046209 RepID=UPI0024BA4829|nr:thiamine pyrophosphate-dependent enzyme [Rhodococcus sp. G-MC3]MDJ0393684.1 thiamine pyrophosphate-dependent enzyme [Rhodococcus sp. G-MC3]